MNLAQSMQKNSPDKSHEKCQYLIPKGVIIFWNVLHTYTKSFEQQKLILHKHLLSLSLFFFLNYYYYFYHYCFVMFETVL